MAEVCNDEGRVCTKCKRFLLWEMFTNSKKGLHGKSSQCKECQKKYRIDNADRIKHKQKEYRECNKDKLSEYFREHYLNNKDIKKEKSRLQRVANPEYYREYNKNYYLLNRHTILDRVRTYTLENKGKVQKYSYSWRNSDAKYNTYFKKLSPFEAPVSNNGVLEVKCATCRKYFTPTNQSAQDRIKYLTGVIENESRLYCSEECKTACSVYNQKKYPKDFTKPIKREYSKEFREMILERDNNTCQVCGEKLDPKELQAHHINPVVCSPMEQLDIENGICVCKECHKKLHDQDGCRYHELRGIKNK